jgi:hypothetical protein
MQHSIVELKKERNTIELFNDSLSFFIKNFRLLLQIVILMTLPIIVIEFSFPLFSTSLIKSSLFNDVSTIIYSYIYNTGINPVYLLLTNYLVSIFIFSYINLYSNQNEPLLIGIKDIYEKIRPTIVSLISLSVVLTILFCIIISCLIYFDIDFKLMFGFSLFYVTYLFIPFIIYFNFLIIYITINDNMNFLNVIKKIKKDFNNPWNAFISMIFILFILFILKYIFTKLLYLILVFVPIDIMPIIGTIFIYPFKHILYIGLITFLTIYITFRFMSEDAKFEGSELLKIIDEIK